MTIWNEKGYYPFQIEVLTPVHIGAGKDFEPMEYVVRNVAMGNYQIWLIDTPAWLAANYEKPEIASALDSGDLDALRHLLNVSSNVGDFILGRIPVRNTELAGQIMSTHDTARSKGRPGSSAHAPRAEIMAFTRNPFTHMPYIPASSLKGAISTALTDALGDDPSPTRKTTLKQSASKKDYEDILTEIYGKIGEHAMKALKMRDIPLPPGLTSVRSAIGRDLGSAKPMPKTPCETLDPCSGKLFGNLRLAGKDGIAAISLPNKRIIRHGELSEICNKFYLKRFRDELEKFYGTNWFPGTREALKPVLDRLATLKSESEILLRVGRYSHIECMLVAAEMPKKPLGPGLSRTLADGLLPFGWIILKQCSMEEFNASAARQDDFWQRQTGKMAKQAAKPQPAQAPTGPDPSLSPEEKLVWLVEQPNSIENQASELFAKLDELGDLQKRAAEALTAFWKRIGKWEGKKLNKKQTDKVAKVRKILGE